MNKVIKLIIVAIVLYLILEQFGMLKNIPNIPMLKSEEKEEKNLTSVSDPFSQCDPESFSECEKPEMEHLSRK
tara:strand:+ start:895 stop:1113 length:219 start_codon:yes stop_codon:yes gene_type:complete